MRLHTANKEQNNRMKEFLEFKKARCKDCYKCLRECPVKAISMIDHEAKIIAERCILCGRCTKVCPQNAKIVHSKKAEIIELLNGNDPIIASIAPSFISSFSLSDFSKMKAALRQIGFAFSEETAVGANAVVKEYAKLMQREKYDNFITSACPAVCRLIQLYYPNALKYLAPVDSPMIAHAKILKKRFPDSKIIFVGPCIAKKREAAESGIIDGVLTFEDLRDLFAEHNIDLETIKIAESDIETPEYANLSKYFPINRGIIKSFNAFTDDYQYISIDGTDRCVQVLENIDTVSGVFVEMNICEYACVNGPCSIESRGGTIKANADIRNYVQNEVNKYPKEPKDIPTEVNINFFYPKIRNNGLTPSEKDITDILAKTGRLTPEDELNCGACGYASCREKAWAVFNGFADIEVCLPYMRERAESMAYEIIQHNPNGIVTLDMDMNIIDINSKARDLFGIEEYHIKGRPGFDFFDTTDFMKASHEKKSVVCDRMYIARTNSYIHLTVNWLKGNNVIFGVMKDITADVDYTERLNAVKMETLATTDEVIKKQMRVAQEIASLLGETTAETKVALLKLKKTLSEGENKE